MEIYFRRSTTSKLFAQPHSLVVTNLERQRNRFGDDVIRREQVIREPTILKLSEAFDGASSSVIAARFTAGAARRRRGWPRDLRMVSV